MSAQDSVDSTERLEMIRLQQVLKKHSANLNLPFVEAVADFIVRGAILAIARKTPPTLLVTGTLKVLLAHKSIIIEELMAKLEQDDSTNNEPGGEEDGGEEEKKRSAVNVDAATKG